MTHEQASWIAYLRSGVGASFGYVSEIVEAIYGPDAMEDMCDVKSSYTIGQRLVQNAEQVLNLDPCELDTMRFGSLVCLNCKKGFASLHLLRDAEKECPYCGKMTSVLSPVLGKGGAG